jgi:hypothetical protein
LPGNNGLSPELKWRVTVSKTKSAQRKHLARVRQVADVRAAAFDAEIAPPFVVVAVEPVVTVAACAYVVDVSLRRRYPNDLGCKAIVKPRSLAAKNERFVCFQGIGMEATSGIEPE